MLVAGSRDFNNYAWLCHKFDSLSYVHDVDFGLIISGGARGVDQAAERWALSKDYDFTEHPALWDEYGPSAGFRRNQTMGELCTHAIIVHDGWSRGTKHMIGVLRSLKKPYVLYNDSR